MNNNFCTIYLVRHGQSEANARDEFSGSGKDASLTEKGRQQAKEIANNLRNIHFDAIFSSSLSRARETAEIIALERKIEVKIMEKLRERDYGSLFKGRKVKEVQAELKDLFEKRRQLSPYERLKFKFSEDYESDEEVISRFLTSLREIAVFSSRETILIASHVSAMKLILVHLGYVKQTDIEGESIENTGYIKLKSDGLDFLVEEVKGLRKT